MNTTHTKQQQRIESIIEACKDGLGYTQVELAEKLSVSPQAVTKWKKSGTIDKDNLRALCRLAGVSVEWALSGAGPRDQREIDSARRAILADESSLRARLALLLDNCDVDLLRAVETMLTARPVSTSAQREALGDTLEAELSRELLETAKKKTEKSRAARLSVAYA